MKKTLLLLSIFISISGFAQTTIVNGDMELWQNVGANNEEPTQWNSSFSGINNATLAPKTCYQETSNPHGGSYCARIETKFYIIQTVPGTCTTGKLDAPTLSGADGYIFTDTLDATARMPFVGRPDSLVGWYRYTSVSSDFASIGVVLHVGKGAMPESGTYQGNTTPNVVARAEFLSPTSSVANWTRFSVPFVYVDGRTPQYFLCVMTSSGGAGAVGSKLWVDDLSVVYNPTIATGTISPSTYYVSATSGASVSVPFTLTGTYNGGNTITAQLSDASGSFASPVTIGSVTATTSGTVNATIPANTASGTGYRIRVISSSPALTAANNGSDITVVLTGNSVAPNTTQNIPVATAGSAVTVTETPAATSREWKYSTVSGGPYTSFAPAQTGTSYTPNFAVAGTYYVACVSSYPGLTVTSNEVIINALHNSIAPTTSQSLLVGVNGNALTVTETPAGMWREWQFGTSPGGPYSSFAPAITGATSYTPNFASVGTYYVVCVSEINGVFLTSNEVLVSVGNATIATGTITGSPFELSFSAPNIPVDVPFTTSGTFSGGNVFTAELSDANGSFSSTMVIGTLNATGSGTINALIDNTTLAGTGYRIRVVSNNPAILGSDNGVDLVIDQFNNSVAPASMQTIMHGVNGTAITVTESQTATREWKYSTTSGSGYMSFGGTAETGVSYTPNFAVPGTYYVVCESTNQYSDVVTSNEVQIDVTNGTTIATSAVTGSPFLVSPSANVQVSVSFTSDVVFNAGNIFKAQLSDNAGSFASPVEIGTLSTSSITPVSATIPNSSPAGTGYRIRVVSTDPAVTGSDNGTDLEVIPFANSIAPTDTQHLLTNQNGTGMAVTETHPSTREWLKSTTSGSGYTSFSPAQTGSSYTPLFAAAGTYYVVCKSENAVNDFVTSPEVVVIVAAPSAVSGTGNELIKVYSLAGNLVVDLSKFYPASAAVELLTLSGQQVFTHDLNSGSVNTMAVSLPKTMYIFRITADGRAYSGKINME